MTQIRGCTGADLCPDWPLKVPTGNGDLTGPGQEVAPILLEHGTYVKAQEDDG